MKRIFTMSILAAAILATGCTRIETGEVGVRVGFDSRLNLVNCYQVHSTKFWWAMY